MLRAHTAVQHPPRTPLQILAGPGSGKTKVLTSRIAHLITEHQIPPQSICAVTFTNKAANEMRERLCKLVGKNVTGQIRMGTFHALCAMFLRKHATLIGVGTNFTVCDADERWVLLPRFCLKIGINIATQQKGGDKITEALRRLSQRT